MIRDDYTMTMRGLTGRKNTRRCRLAGEGEGTARRQGRPVTVAFPVAPVPQVPPSGVFNARCHLPSVGNFRTQVLDFEVLLKNNNSNFLSLRASTVIFP